jgi:hypothetical protein
MHQAELAKLRLVDTAGHQLALQGMEQGGGAVSSGPVRDATSSEMCRTAML